MSDLLPSVAQAYVDGNGPAKRTRRPALSCVECRMRKVKCDRKRPCGACTRMKLEKCTYRPARAGIRFSVETSPQVASTAGSNTAASCQSPARSSAQLSCIPDVLESTAVDPHIVPDSLGESDQAALNPLSTRATPGLSSHADTGASLIAALLKENEQLRVEATHVAIAEGDIRPISDIVTDLPGTFQKSKFFGQSHWMNALEPYEALGEANITVNPATDRVEVNKSTELYKTVDELKTMGRIMKTARMLLPNIPPEVLTSLPSKATCDVLIDGYLRTFEGVFRVLHVPSFRKEYEDYWSGTVSGKPSVLLKIMLVCAIGVPFYTGVDQPRLRVACAKWVQAAESWLAGPHAKSRLNMAGLQIQILVLIAKQVCNVEGDHVWIPAGALLRTAMFLGLHRDPSYFGKINTFHAEMRRRLWATVLELTVQSSLDMGMPPLISVDEYDTKPPSNVNDEDLCEQDDSPLSVQPPDVCTDCSIQIAFIKTIVTRLEMVRLINSLRFTLPYSECLRLSQKLTVQCDSAIETFKRALQTGAHITPFQIKLHDALTRRFTLALHRPFFTQAASHPEYHFSRKTCLDASLALFAPATPPLPGPADDWTLLTHRAAGFLKSILLYALSTIHTELHAQISEAAHTARLTRALICTAPSHAPVAVSLPPPSQPLYAALRAAHATCLARLRNGETNAKGVVFVACAMARVDARLAGVGAAEVAAAVLGAAVQSVACVRRIMARVWEQEQGGVGEVEGEGALRGEAGCGADADADCGMEMDLDLDLHVDGVVGGGSSNNVQGFSEGDGLGFDADFLADPEWFFDSSGWADFDSMGLANF